MNTLKIEKRASIVYVTAGNLENASLIAKELVSKRLAACVNMFPVSSIYRWKGKIEEDNEIALFIKTEPARIQEIIKLVKSLHTYEMPAIEFWGIEGEQDYLDWICVNSTAEEA